jgi:adenylate cyclase
VVIAGTIGGGGKLEFTLIGDTVNVAARKAAKAA